MPYILPSICCRRKQESACACQHLLAARIPKILLVFADLRKTEGPETISNKGPSHKWQSPSCLNSAMRSVSNSSLQQPSGFKNDLKMKVLTVKVGAGKEDHPHLFGSHSIFVCFTFFFVCFSFTVQAIAQDNQNSWYGKFIFPEAIQSWADWMGTLNNITECNLQNTTCVNIRGKWPNFKE